MAFPLRIHYGGSALHFKHNSMGQNKLDKKPASNKATTTGKDHKGDTGRSSNQGRKEASGGKTQTSNRGHEKGS